MRRVLMVSPHFPPDSSAGTHRVRLLAAHLPEHGWSPTVVTVDPRDYETRLDAGLAALVPASLDVVRCRAMAPRWTRRVGFGDLGLRALPGLLHACRRQLRSGRFAALFITVYPTYPALLGPLLKRRFGVRFVLDYQDPWVGSWGASVGGGAGGRPDRRSRLTRALAARLEPVVVRAADAITAVSEGTYEEVLERHPFLRDTPCEAFPVGGEPQDFADLAARPRANPFFDPGDGDFHLCYVGTLLPLGFETLAALLAAAALVRERRPDLYRRLRLRFFGTSNQTATGVAARVLPEARRLGVQDRVAEVPARIDYLDALNVLTQSSAILMLGSSESHYTASKLYPALLARRPLLAAYHSASTVAAVVRAATRPPSVRLVTYDDTHRAGERTEAIFAELSSLLESPVYRASDVDWNAVDRFSARAIAGRLAALLDRITNGAAGERSAA
jgi:hypothetical protein